MADDQKPWGGAPKGNSYRLRFLIWIVFIAAIAIGLVVLSRLFPGQVSDDLGEAYLTRNVAILAFVGSGIIFGWRRIHLKSAARNALIWVGLFLVLAGGYAYQDELRAFGLRLRSELIPGYAVQSNPDELVLTESPGGNFYVFGAVNGEPVKFLIDTGASEIVLSPSDALRAGLDTNALDYNRSYETANGPVRGADATVHSLSIGSIEFSDVAVSVNKADMGESLLGMTFLRRMGSVEFRGRQLFLHWRQ